MKPDLSHLCSLHTYLWPARMTTICHFPTLILSSSPPLSVILTSGTLSPLDTFASELGTEFKQTLEAPHVADVKKQVWAGVLPSGPDRVKLKADYATSSSLQFQDSVGSSVLRLCQVRAIRGLHTVE